MNDLVLYRFYNQRGTLLYVGLTLSPGNRFRAHRTDKQWWREVAGITLQRYESFEALAAAEIEAIQSEKPKYNKAHAIPPETVRVSTNELPRSLWPDANRFHTEHRDEPITAEVPAPQLINPRGCPICLTGQALQNAETKITTCDTCTSGEMCDGVDDARFEQLHWELICGR